MIVMHYKINGIIIIIIIIIIIYILHLAPVVFTTSPTNNGRVEVIHVSTLSCWHLLYVPSHGVLYLCCLRHYFISPQVGHGWQVEDVSSRFLSLAAPSLLNQLRFLSVSGFFGIEAGFIIVGA